MDALNARLAEVPAEDGDWLDQLGQYRGAYAEGTIAKAARSFRFFRSWCATEGLRSLPAEPATIAAFLDHHAAIFAPRTMAMHLCGVRRVHDAMRLPDPIKEEAVRLARLRQLRAHPRPRRIVVTEEIRDRLLAACPDKLFGIRDRAMINLAFDTFCLRPELCLFRIEDIQVLEGGTARLVVRRPVGQADAAHDCAFLSRRGVAAVQAWLSAAGLESGPILRPVCGDRVLERPLHKDSVSSRLQKCAELAGIHMAPGQYLGIHSFRVGAAQALALHGRTLTQIMRAGRWHYLRQPARYLREAPQNVWANRDSDSAGNRP